MEWVKLAAVPAYYVDGALLRAGEAAEVLFCRGLAHCGAVESAGLIEKTVLPMLVPTRTQARATALVREGLWIDEGTHYRIRSWDKWQDQHDAAADRRRKDRERQREVRRRARERDNADTSRDSHSDSHAPKRDSHAVEGEGDREGESPTDSAPCVTTLGNRLLDAYRQQIVGGPVPRKALAKVGTAIDNLLSEGIEAEAVFRALHLMHGKQLGVSLLPDLVAQAQRPGLRVVGEPHTPNRDTPWFN